LLGLAVRGPGLISPKLFLGGSDSPFCTGYAFIIMFFGYVNNVSLVPITLDRCIAVVSPWRHKLIFRKSVCIALCILTWVPNLAFLVYELVQFSKGELKIPYRGEIGRCGFDNFLTEETAKDVVCLWAPLAIILIMYVLILKEMIQNYHNVKKLMMTSAFIVIPSVLSWLPYFLFNILNSIIENDIPQNIMHWSYIVFYVTVATNPLVYIFGYKNIRLVLTGDLVVRKNRRKSLCPKEFERSQSTVTNDIITKGGKRISRVVSPSLRGGISGAVLSTVIKNPTISTIEELELVPNVNNADNSSGAERSRYDVSESKSSPMLYQRNTNTNRIIVSSVDDVDDIDLD